MFGGWPALTTQHAHALRPHNANLIAEFGQWSWIWIYSSLIASPAVAGRYIFAVVVDFRGTWLQKLWNNKNEIPGVMRKKSDRIYSILGWWLYDGHERISSYVFMRAVPAALSIVSQCVECAENQSSQQGTHLFKREPTPSKRNSCKETMFYSY
jgi:hypothetical protein